MQYEQVPVPGGEPLPRDALERVEAIVAAEPGRPVLLHCSSGNRAAAWLATHLVTRHGMEVGDALAVARRAGLTKPDMEEKVRAYLHPRAPRPTAPDELSELDPPG
jgi:protein tyrosine phosphatase (PTP) superfamily phosphohydrolase (DUF442 family)